jgi:hypothetical protein
VPLEPTEHEDRRADEECLSSCVIRVPPTSRIAAWSTLASQRGS